MAHESRAAELHWDLSLWSAIKHEVVLTCALESHLSSACAGHSVHPTETRETEWVQGSLLL